MGGSSRLALFKRGPGLILLASSVLWAEDPLFEIHVIEPPPHSTFGPLLRIRIYNEEAKTLELGTALNAGTWKIDGKVRKSTVTLPTAVGVGAFQSWDGCLPLEPILKELKPGSHTLQLTVTELESKKVRFRWERPRNPDDLKPPERLKEIEAIADRLEDGLPRGCVELWFSNKDGGLQESTMSRYYVHPFIKVAVPYDNNQGPESLQNRIAGPLRVYRELPVAD